MTKIPENPPNASSGRPSESHIPKNVGSEKVDKKFKPPVDKKHKDKNMDIDKDAKLHPERPKPFVPDSKHPHKPIGPDKRYDPKHPDKSKESKVFDNEPEKSKEKSEKSEKSEKPEKPEKPEKKKEDKITDPEVNVFQTPGMDIKSQAFDVKEVKSSEISPADATKAMSQIREVVVRMVSTLRTGVVGDMPVHQMDLKTTTDVPVFLRGASVMITKEAPGRISISISNLNASNTNMTIKAIETQTAQLQQLMQDLAQRQLSIADLRVGDHSIALPRLEALPPTPFSAASEGFTDRRRDESGGGEDRGGGGRDRDQEKGDRERR